MLLVGHGRELMATGQGTFCDWRPVATSCRGRTGHAADGVSNCLGSVADTPQEDGVHAVVRTHAIARDARPINESKEDSPMTDKRWLLLWGCRLAACGGRTCSDFPHILFPNPKMFALHARSIKYNVACFEPHNATGEKTKFQKQVLLRVTLPASGNT